MSARAPAIKARGSAALTAKHQALLTVNAHLLRRFEVTLPKVLDVKGLRWLNEQLALMTREWLDALADDLTESRKDSPSREAATRRCVDAVEKTAGIVFPEPKIYTTEGMSVMNDPLKKTITAAPSAPAPSAPAPAPAAKKPEAKKPQPSKKTAAKKKPAKKAAKKKGPPPIKPNLGKAAVKKGAAAKKPRAHDGDEDKITVLTPGRENPKKKGTKVYDDFQLYLRAKTVGEYRKLGGSMVSLRDDIGRGHVKRG